MSGSPHSTIRRLTGAVFLVAALSLSALRGTGAGDPAELGLVFAANRRLTLEDCGCTLRPGGALARELRYVGERRAGAGTVLYLAAGVALLPDPAAETSSDPVKDRESLVDNWSKAGLTAFHPAPEDLALGEATLRALHRRARFPFVVTNAKGGESYLETEVSVDWNGKRVRILGLVPAGAKVPGLEIEAPAAALTRVLADVKTDLVVVLSSLAPEEERAIADSLPGLAVLLGSQGTDYGGSHPAPGVVVAHPYGGGKELADLTVRIPGAASRWFDASARAEAAAVHAAYRNEIDFLRLALEDNPNRADVKQKLGAARAFLDSLPPLPEPGVGEAIHTMRFNRP